MGNMDDIPQFVINDNRGKKRNAPDVPQSSEDDIRLAEQARLAAIQDAERAAEEQVFEVTTAYLICVTSDGNVMAATGLVNVAIQTEEGEPPKELVMLRPATLRDISWTSRDVADQMLAQRAASETVRELMNRQQQMMAQAAAVQQMSPEVLAQLRSNGIQPGNPFLR